MSNVSTSHNVVPFVSGKSEALTGQRLVIAKYKSTAKQAAKHPNVCASVPVLEIVREEITESLMVHVNEWLREKQDAVFKSVYESHGGTLSSVNDAELDISAIVGFLSAQSVSGRLTKELIDSWYKSEAEGTVKVLFAVSLGFIASDAEDGEFEVTEEQDKKLDSLAKVYGEFFSGLAGGATRYDIKRVESLRKVLGNVGDSAITERLSARLDSMVQKVEEVEEYL